MKQFVRSRRGAIFLVVLVGFFLRLYAAFQLPLDFDEPIYMQAAFDYASYLRAGNLPAVVDYPENQEHPPLTKLIYSLAILPQGENLGWSDAFLFGRLVSVVFGTLAVWVLAVVDPLAGFLLAIQTYAVKYTSQAYLEAVPLFASLAALFALRYSKVSRDRWFWISAAALGLTAAGKYSYLPIFVVIFYIFFSDKKFSWKDLILYLGVVGLSFLALDPHLWRDPLQRLFASLFFHTQYAQGQHVQEAANPWYQPLIWLSRSKPYEWHPDVFFYNPLEGIFSVDGIIFVFALVGLPLEWRQRRYVLVWIVVGLIALLLWPTKWPQYILVVVPALCLAASTSLRRVFGYFRHLEDYYGWVHTMIPMPPAAMWVVLILSIALFGTITAVTGINIYRARQGWSHVMADLSALPSNRIYSLSTGPAGEMVVGTSSGAAIWQAVEGANSDEQWQILNKVNTPLPDNEILSSQFGPQGELWLGTRNGLVSYDGKTWQVFDAQAIGLPSAAVFDIQFDRSGRTWIGTNSGAAVYENSHWRTFTPQNSNLGNALVLSVATRSDSDVEKIYFGTSAGLFAYDPTADHWQRIEPDWFHNANGGVADLYVDSANRLWVATLGSGLSVWDGSNWNHFTMANSDIPTNRIDRIFQDDQGNFWIGASFPERPGGVLAQFNGQEWKTFTFRYTGYSGGSVVAIAQDDRRRLWFGTQALGLDIFDPTD